MTFVDGAHDLFFEDTCHKQVDTKIREALIRRGIKDEAEIQKMIEEIERNCKTHTSPNKTLF